MSTDAERHRLHQQHAANVSYDAVGLEVATETTVDVRLPDNLTDWQLTALDGLQASGKDCLIRSWRNSSYSGNSSSCCYYYITIGWRFGLVVTRWPRLTSLPYVRPG